MNDANPLVDALARVDSDGMKRALSAAADLLSALGVEPLSGP